MAERNSFLLYKNWMPMVMKLSKDVCGELFYAIAAFEMGADYEFEDQNAAAIFEMIKIKLEEDKYAYEATVERNRANGAKNKSKANREEPNNNPLDSEENPLDSETHPVGTKNDNDKKNDNENDNENETVKDNEKPTVSEKRKVEKKSADALIADAAISEPLADKTRDWIRYKQERREPYKDTGLKALITQISNREQQYGTVAVMTLIDDCMANGWRGIIWDRLDKPQQKKTMLERIWEA